MTETSENSYGLRPKRRRSQQNFSETSEGNVDRLLALAESSSKIVVFSGSGLSASSGMSTFSTRGGLYERAQKKYKLSDGKMLFTYLFFDRQRPEAQAFFADIYSEAVRAEPAQGHYALRELFDAGRLHRHYTLNIDGLAAEVGMDTWHHELNPTGVTVEMHGNVRHLVCPECHATLPMSAALAKQIKAKVPVPCTAIGCGHGAMRFKVMMYDDGEAECITPDDVMELMEEDVKLADLVLWVGISFQQSASTSYFRQVRGWMQEAAAAKGRGSSAEGAVQAIINPSDEALFNLRTAMSNQAELRVLEVLAESDEVLPLMADRLRRGRAAPGSGSGAPRPPRVPSAAQLQQQQLKQGAASGGAAAGAVAAAAAAANGLRNGTQQAPSAGAAAAAAVAGPQYVQPLRPTLLRPVLPQRTGPAGLPLLVAPPPPPALLQAFGITPPAAPALVPVAAPAAIPAAVPAVPPPGPAGWAQPPPLPQVPVPAAAATAAAQPWQQALLQVLHLTGANGQLAAPAAASAAAPAAVPVQPLQQLAQALGLGSSGLPAPAAAAAKGWLPPLPQKQQAAVPQQQPQEALPARPTTQPQEALPARPTTQPQEALPAGPTTQPQQPPALQQTPPPAQQPAPLQQQTAVPPAGHEEQQPAQQPVQQQQAPVQPQASVEQQPAQQQQASVQQQEPPQQQPLQEQHLAHKQQPLQEQQLEQEAPLEQQQEPAQPPQQQQQAPVQHNQQQAPAEQQPWQQDAAGQPEPEQTQDTSVVPPQQQQALALPDQLQQPQQDSPAEQEAQQPHESGLPPAAVGPEPAAVKGSDGATLEPQPPADAVPAVAAMDP